jgi:hypothetical protein
LPSSARPFSSNPALCDSAQPFKAYAGNSAKSSLSLRVRLGGAYNDSVEPLIVVFCDNSPNRIEL